MVDLQRFENRYYPEPKEKAQNIKDYVAFYKVDTFSCAMYSRLQYLTWD